VASLKYTGNMYAVLLGIDAKQPKAKQIKAGLDSKNHKISKVEKILSI